MPGATVKIGECARNFDVDYYWAHSRAVWTASNNSIQLLDFNEKLIATF